MMKIRKVIFIGLGVLGGLYVLLGVFLFVAQKSILYYPDDRKFEECFAFSDYEKMDYNGTRFYFKEQSSRALVFYHGNARSACDESFLKPLFEASGASVLFVEYAGYAGYDQGPSKDLILQDVQNIHDFLEEQSFTDTIVFGESLGSGPASYHASLGGVSRLVLVSSFSSMEDLAQFKFKIYPMSVLLKEDYDNVKSLKKFDGDLLMIHGEQDTLIPFSFSRALFDSFPGENKEYVLIPDYGHNFLWNSEIVQGKIAEFIGVEN